jgi:hypothetical protein
MYHITLALEPTYSVFVAEGIFGVVDFVENERVIEGLELGDKNSGQNLEDNHDSKASKHRTQHLKRKKLADRQRLGQLQARFAKSNNNADEKREDINKQVLKI